MLSVIGKIMMRAHFLLDLLFDEFTEQLDVLIKNAILF